MPSAKRTIARDSVFRNTGAAPREVWEQASATSEPPTRQTAVWLMDYEVDWLDSRCQEIKRGGWRNVTRSAFIRALIRAAMAEPPDLTGVENEPDLVQRVTRPR